MGRESRVVKARVCQVCKQRHHLTTAGLLEHTQACERLVLLGLVRPDAAKGLILPKGYQIKSREA